MEPFEYKGRNWVSICAWGLIGLISFLSICGGIVILPYGWLGAFFLIGGLVFLFESWHFGRKAFAIKHLILDKDAISFFRGRKNVFKACWTDVDDLRYSPKILRYSTSAIRIIIKGHEYILTGEMDLPPWKIHEIFLKMERTWNEGKVIDVESV